MHDENETTECSEVKVKEAVISLAENGHSKQDATLIVSSLFPEVSQDRIDGAFASAGPVFDVSSRGGQSFSENEILLSIELLYALENRLILSPVEAAAFISADDVMTMERTLRNSGYREDLLNVVLRRQAATRHARLAEELTAPSKARFEATRKEFLTEHGIESGKGLSPWPPTAQTIMKRFSVRNSWSEAVGALGFKANDRGRPLGHLAYSDEAYELAMSKYLESVTLQNLKATYDGYEKWVLKEETSGRHHPSGPAVRLKYQNWNNAVRTGGYRRTAAVHKQAQMLSQDEGYCLRAKDQSKNVLEEVRTLDRPAAHSEVKEIIKRELGTFEINFRSWFREAVEYADEDPSTVALRLKVKDDRKRAEAASAVTSALTDFSIDKTLADRDSFDRGWLPPSLFSQNPPVGQDTVDCYFAARELRNLFTHSSKESRRRAVDALNGAFASAHSFAQGMSERQIAQKLVAKDFELFGLVLSSCERYWAEISQSLAGLP